MSNRGSLKSRLAAVAEVLVAFALVHVGWRSFKHFSRLGQLEAASQQNLSPGLIMIAFTVLAVRLRGWRLSDFGLNLHNARYHLTLGILWGLLSLSGLVLVVLLTGYRPAPGGPPNLPWRVSFVASAVAAAYGLLLIAMLRRRRRAIASVPLPGALAVLLALVSLPLVLHGGRQAGHTVLLILSMFIGAGFGEEIFFRGYVQTRLDLAWGKPFALAGVRVGMGLLVSSLLFGLVHALNPVDYFGGRFDFNWPLGLVECVEGACLGIMRQMTGSVFPCAVAHGLADVLQYGV